MESQNQNMNQHTAQVSTSNSAWVSESALELRLDTQKLLDELRMFLEATEYQFEEKNGTRMAIKATIPECEPKANREGVNSLMFRMRSLMNQSTVQGNWTEDMFRFRLSGMRKSLAYDITINAERWGIAEYDMNLVCDAIMDVMWSFLSRLIGNKEREALSPKSMTESFTNARKSEGVFKQ